MLTTGVDIVEIPRVQRVLAGYGRRFLERIFTEGEIAYCRGRAPNLVLERAIGLEAEVLLGERGHQSVDCRRSGEAM